MPDIPRQACLLLVRAYRRAISPFMPACCRFHPSCSKYALEALQKKPLLMAFRLIARRLFRCHPLHPGGYDPVP